MVDEKGLPRWAMALGVETWDRINELLQDGWDTRDILRELKIPASKKRSLQLHARKYGPRRRLQRFAQFKDAMLGGAAAIGPDFGIRIIGLPANPDTARGYTGDVFLDEFAMQGRSGSVTESADVPVGEWPRRLSGVEVIAGSPSGAIENSPAIHRWDPAR